MISQFEDFQSFLCFYKLAQGFLSTQEGMVFKWVQKGSPAASPWQIFVMEKDGSFTGVGRQQTRPSIDQVQMALYNKSAVNSPITKGISFLKGLGKKK